MLKAVLRCPTSFFDTTPLGRSVIRHAPPCLRIASACSIALIRLHILPWATLFGILNRFSGDQNTVDNSLPGTLNSYASCILQVLTNLITIAFATPLFIVGIIPVFALYVTIQR
jgi:hypothetical protein